MSSTTKPGFLRRQIAAFKSLWGVRPPESPANADDPAARPQLVDEGHPTLAAHARSLVVGELSEIERDLVKAVVDVSTGVWRIRRRFLEEGSNDGSASLRSLFRQVESAWGVLAMHDIDLRDHAGQKYVPGMALKVLAYQPLPDAIGERILETVRPTIYYRGSLVQRGEVIVSIPPTPEPSSETPPPPDTPAATDAAAAVTPAASDVPTEAGAVSEPVSASAEDAAVAAEAADGSVASTSNAAEQAPISDSAPTSPASS